MPIYCVGLNHRTAPLELRERLAFSRSQIRATLARCGYGDREAVGNSSELTLLSTCHRTELYAVAGDDADGALIDLLAESSGVPRAEFEPHLYQFRQLQAARHLFRVAAGLDSMVLGEPQILGQVAEAHTLALSVGATGLVLSRVFRSALHAGKRARHETAIAAKPATISSVAVHLVASLVPDLQHAHILVVGTGEMAKLSVEALRKRTVERITVINRTLTRAQALANRWSAEAKPFEALQQALAEADVVICSTGAPHAIIRRELVSRATTQRPRRPLILMDIAVPRDVDEDVEELDQVYVYDLDRIQEHLTQSVEEREAEVPQVVAILEEEMDSFIGWYAGLAIRPVIKAIRQQAEEIRGQVLARTLRRLSDLSPEAQQELEATGPGCWLRSCSTSRRWPSRSNPRTARPPSTQCSPANSLASPPQGSMLRSRRSESGSAW